MPEKARRDLKGRKLLNGESQRKDGKYEYKYTDSFGKRRTLYSWKLASSDPLPPNKCECVALRDLEKQVQRNWYNALPYEEGETKVLDLVKKYISQKQGVRHSTKANYQFVVNILQKEEFGMKRIDKVRLSDAKCWLIKLQNDGRGYSTVHAIRGIVRPAFQMAVDDDILRKNPFDFQLHTVIVNDSVRREALTRQQERDFLDFVKKDKHYAKYYDAIFLLFKTGLRISEFAGLTIKDIDFTNNRINVDHQLQRTSNMEYVIQTTKTACGTRMIPMIPEVRETLERIIAQRKKPKIEPIIGGKSGFLYLDKNNKPMVALHWEKYFNRITDKYNGIYKVQLPNVTPHVCRHTFCSNMAKSGMNPKTLQYIMGHSEIGVTLNTYTHFGYEDAENEMLESKFTTKVIKKI